MNYYPAIREYVNLPEAAAYYGADVKRGEMMCCLFHADRSPSMKLYKDHFHCFGCGAHGDTVAFVAQYFGIPREEAVKRLVTDFGIELMMKNINPNVKPIRRIRLCTKEEEALCIEVISDYYQILMKWKELYAPEKGEEPDERFVEAVHNADMLSAMYDEITIGKETDRHGKVRSIIDSGRIDRYLKRLGEIREMEKK